MIEKKITLVIPCLNEEKGLEKLLPTIPKIIDQVLIVDGNSQDNTAEVAKKYGAEVIVEPKRGYGLALRTGFNAAKNPILITLDGDGTYPIDQLEFMYNYFLDKDLDFLVACRFPLRDRRAMTVKNFFGNLLISSFTSLLFNYQVNDVCSGMWAMTKQSWNKLEPKINDNKWFFSNEIKIEAIKDAETAYDEFPIQLSVRAGQTKVGNVWLIGLRVLLQTFLKRFG